MVVRELTGGLYFGAKMLEATTRPSDTCTYDRARRSSGWRGGRSGSPAADPAGSSRSTRQNVLATSKLWRRVVTELHAAEYAEIELTHELVDSFAMNLATRPQRYDVILTENLFGDILSDLAAAVGGGLGIAPSASLGPEAPGIFEPVHGSAPDIAGQSEANPIAMILSVAMMFTLRPQPARHRPGDHRGRRLGARRRDRHRRPGLAAGACTPPGRSARRSATRWATTPPRGAEFAEHPFDARLVARG